jgi:FkbM family methyltransferase
LAARNWFPSATLHAYEPNQRVLDFLTNNISGLSVQVFPEAVGGSVGCVDVIDHGDSNRVTTRLCASGATAQISLATVVERIGGSIDLLKLDCEGAAWDLLMTDRPWEAVRRVRMEYHLLQRFETVHVVRALTRLGFSITSLHENSQDGIVWADRP